MGRKKSIKIKFVFRPLLFWDVTQPRLMVVYWHFGTICLQSATNLRHVTSYNSRGHTCTVVEECGLTTHVLLPCWFIPFCGSL